MVVTLPLYSQSLENKSDPYYLLFSSSLIFPFFFFALLLITKAFDRTVSLRLRAPLKYVLAAGCLNALNGLMVVYASDPSRTSPTLQAILSTSIIPFTVIARYVIIRQGVGWKRLACTGVVLVGLFISMEPVIFNIDNEGSSSGDKGLSTAERVLWPIIFLVGFLPLAVMNVLLEKVMKEEVSSLLVNVWVNIFQLIVVTLLFWTDFIPHFGVSSTPNEFWSSFTNGFRCQYGADSTCSEVVGRSWLFVVSYAAANIFNFLLLRHSDGAIYLVVVQALVTPLGAIFWTLFVPKPYFHWYPQFDLATGFTVAGLIIMMPAVTVYHYLGKRGLLQRAWVLTRETFTGFGTVEYIVTSQFI
ncbi:crt homolog 3-like [Ptychodera flava]|uniref:crt homolog 3-like n=1 Tax=Ptychodera flava TaxID=63121 RepID=UPI003969C58A